MSLVRINICCGPKVKDNNFFYRVVGALSEVTFTQEDHGLAKVPRIEIYEVSNGMNFRGEIQVNTETFDVTVSQEDPIPFIIIMN
jgi:hypothetical protein